jgi:1,6-anhydro-N-acetylmuramate kinase
LEERLELLKKSDARVIVGIETGSMPGRIGAVIVEVSGSGADTVLDLHAFESTELPTELVTALTAADGEKKISAKEQADINFLVVHQLNTLFFELLESLELDPEEVDLIGLKGMEIGEMEFPDDPGVLSEMTGCIVASCFRIGPEKGLGNWLPVKEGILKGMVEAMVEKYDLDEEAREAVAVALLANESVYHEALPSKCSNGRAEGGDRSPRRSLTVQRSSDGEPALHGEFYFPAD